MTNEVATQQPQTLKGFLTSDTSLERISDVLPPGKDPKRLALQVSTMVTKNPYLAECSRISILQSLVQAAELGLEFTLNEAHMVPYFNRNTNGREAQMQIGYKGLMNLVYRSGKLSNMSVEVVYKGDKFKHGTNMESGPYLEHEPMYKHSSPDDITYVYGIAFMHDGGRSKVVMTKDEIDKVKRSSKATKKDSPWNTWYEEMAKKTVIKRLCKMLPMQVIPQEFIEAMMNDDMRDQGRMFGDDEVIEATATEVQHDNSLDELASAVGLAPDEPEADEDGTIDQRDPENVDNGERHRQDDPKEPARTKRKKKAAAKKKAATVEPDEAMEFNV